MGRTSAFAAGTATTINPATTDLRADRVSPPSQTLRHDGAPGADAGPENRFDTFAEALREELAPVGLLESIMADRVILAAWRLGAANRDESEGNRAPSKVSARRAHSATVANTRRTYRDERVLEKSLGLFQALQARRQPRWGVSAVAPAAVPAPCGVEEGEFPLLSNEWPTLPSAIDHDTSEDGAATADLDQNWQDRLIFDDNVSESSPVVKGTWVTVRHVVSLIVDGYTWSDILRSHPELTEEDIRACLSYTVAQDNDEV